MVDCGVGWVTEGEAAFGEMSGSTPMSIHQQALRGIALVALERGDKAAAMAQVTKERFNQCGFVGLGSNAVAQSIYEADL